MPRRGTRTETAALAASMGRAQSRRRPDWADGWTNGIDTERLILRALSKRDYNAWRSGYASRRPAQHRYDHGPVATDRLGRAQFNALAARHERLARRDRVYVLTAFTRGAGEHVGTFDLSIIRRKDTGWANVGYVIHNHHQRLKGKAAPNPMDCRRLSGPNREWLDYSYLSAKLQLFFIDRLAWKFYIQLAAGGHRD